MLFVFGYRASKIRSKKLSVLIHKSENHKDLKSCTVAVHFQKIVDTGVSNIFLERGRAKKKEERRRRRRRRSGTNLEESKEKENRKVAKYWM